MIYIIIIILLPVTLGFLLHILTNTQLMIAC